MSTAPREYATRLPSRSAADQLVQLGVPELEPAVVRLVRASRRDGRDVSREFRVNSSTAPNASSTVAAAAVASPRRFEPCCARHRRARRSSAHFCIVSPLVTAVSGRRWDRRRLAGRGFAAAKRQRRPTPPGKTPTDHDRKASTVRPKMGPAQHPHWGVHRPAGDGAWEQSLRPPFGGPVVGNSDRDMRGYLLIGGGTAAPPTRASKLTPLLTRREYRQYVDSS